MRISDRLNIMISEIFSSIMHLLMIVKLERGKDTYYDIYHNKVKLILFFITVNSQILFVCLDLVSRSLFTVI